VKREDLDRPGVQVLNRGGFGNPDVLVVPTPGGPVVVKDYASRGRMTRLLLAPLLVRHEVASLTRAAGLPGVPGWGERVDRLALAMEYMDGEPLRRHRHAGVLPAGFFDALEGILEGLAVRGLSHLDLRSPTNVLVTPTAAPALVDLVSAWALPLPSGLRRWIEQRAVAKLRARFDLEGYTPPPSHAGAPEDAGPWGVDLGVGGLRWRRYEAGRPDDPVPALLLSDLAVGALAHGAALATAGRFGRRAIAVDLPGAGGSSRWPRRTRVREVAQELSGLLDALRLRHIDVVALGLGGLVGRALVSQRPDRVRSLVTVDTPIDRAPRPDVIRIDTARRHPDLLPALLEKGLSPEFPSAIREALVRDIKMVPAHDLRRSLTALTLRRGRVRNRGLFGRQLPRPRGRWLALFSSPEHPAFGEVERLAGVDARVSKPGLPRAEAIWTWLQERVEGEPGQPD
jgi:pimeloyl-ACP methyl ester carboxylesterase